VLNISTSSPIGKMELSDFLFAIKLQTMWISLPRYSFNWNCLQILKNALIIHEENTKETTAVLYRVVLYRVEILYTVVLYRVEKNPETFRN
jgi:hypothetical protein